MYEELVKRLREIVPWECFLTCKNTMREAADAIEVLSKTEKTTRWIPVTERLPEKSDCFYLVVLNNWNTDFCLYTKEKGFGMYITPKWWDANDEVPHWMRPPEPPKEET